MHAVVAAEEEMVAEDRIARLEGDVEELKDDVKTLNTRVAESSIANAREFGTLRTEIEKSRLDTEKGFGALRTELEGDRTQNAKEFGAVRTEIEKLRAEVEKGFGLLSASIESAKLWMLVTGVGSVILVTFVTFLGRALKIL